MSHPFFHSKSSAKTFGGKPQDYEKIHCFIDSSKALIADHRHRCLYHHAGGPFVAEQVFGLTIKNSDGKDVPVRTIVEKHIIEDIGHIPVFADWLREMPICDWMGKKSKRLSVKFNNEQNNT